MPADAPPAGTYSQTCPEEAVPPSAAVDQLRRKIGEATITGGRVRSRTIAPRPLTRDERRASELVVYPADILRPLERGDCEKDTVRPCAWVSCKHHLYLDVNEETGAMKLNFPHLEVWEMRESCSLDVADRGGITLEETGAIINVTRERIRQVEVRGLEKIKRRDGDNLEAIAG